MNEGRVEVDDLFGDPATLGDTVGLNLPLQSMPVEGLAQYVDGIHRASKEQYIHLTTILLLLHTDYLMQQEAGVVEIRVCGRTFIRRHLCQH